MRRVSRVACLVLPLAVLLAGPLAQVRDTGAQDPAATAADTAILLADLEIAGDWDGLYALLHPDALAFVPFEAMAGWYADAFLPRGPYPIEVLDVHFVEWTWDVTGVTYPWTAAVLYRQTFWDDGAETTVETFVHLVEADGEWRWFFGGDMSFLSALVAAYAPAPVVPDPGPATLTAAPDLPGVLYADLDAFWAAVFAEWGLDYRSPGFVAFAEELSTPCGVATTGLGPASYCPLDGTIYWETGWQERLGAERGDYAWAAVIAHEWGHHVQALAGLSRSLAPDALGEHYPIDLELQADCMSGAYTRDAEWRGLLAPGDVSAATALAVDSGDAASVPWYDAAAHGTPDMRATSFLIGYTDGVAGCDLAA